MGIRLDTVQLLPVYL